MTDMTTSQSLNDISKIELDPNLIQERESWEILDISPPKQSSQSSQSSQTPRNSPEDALLPLPLPLLPPPPPAYPAPSKDDYYIDLEDDSTYRCRRSSGVEYIFTESKPHPIAIFRDGALEWIDQSAHLQHMLETYEILKNENKILKQKNKYCIDTLDILEKKAIKYEMLYLKEKVRNYEEQFVSSDEEFVFSDDSGEDY